MPPFGLTAVASAGEYAATLGRRALECRAFGHAWNRPKVESGENGLQEIHRACQCGTTKVSYLNRRGKIVRARTEYTNPNYLRKGQGVLSSEQRQAIRGIALERLAA